MAATSFYISTMTRAKSNTLAASFANFCLAGLDSNPDTFETAAATNPTILIDMDYTGAAIGYLHFAGVWLVAPTTGTYGTITVHSGSTAPGSTLRGSRNFYDGGGGQRLLIVENFTSTDRYWQIAFSGFTVQPKVREIMIGRKIDLTYRWDWQSPMARLSMASTEELRGGRIISTLQRQNQGMGDPEVQPGAMTRNYELLPTSELLNLDLAYKIAHGQHSLMIVSDDNLTAPYGTVMRFADGSFGYSSVAYGLWQASIGLKSVPMIADGDVF
jgi:hypothetical protein